MAHQLDAFALHANNFQTNLVQGLRAGRGIRTGDQNSWASFTRMYRNFRHLNGLPPDNQWPTFNQISQRAHGEAMGGQRAPEIIPDVPRVVHNIVPQRIRPNIQRRRIAERDQINMDLEDIENERIGNEQEHQVEQYEVQGGAKNSDQNRRIQQLTSTMGPWGKQLSDGNLLISKEFGYTGRWRKKDESQFVQATPNLLRTSKIGSGVPFKSLGSELGEHSVEYGKMTDPDVVHIPSKFHFFIFSFFNLISNFLWIYLNLLDTKLMMDHHLRNQTAMRNFEKPFLEPKHRYLRKAPSGMNNRMSKEQMYDKYENTRPNQKM
jgi:hypothetical protein